MLQEISEKELRVRWERAGSREAVLFYTPLCGTCKLAERIRITSYNVCYTKLLRSQLER